MLYYAIRMNTYRNELISLCALIGIRKQHITMTEFGNDIPQHPVTLRSLSLCAHGPHLSQWRGVVQQRQQLLRRALRTAKGAGRLQRTPPVWLPWQCWVGTQLGSSKRISSNDNQWGNSWLVVEITEVIKKNKNSSPTLSG